MKTIQLRKMKENLTVCKVDSLEKIDLHQDLFFIAKTEEEISLVCPTEKTPLETIEREDGWRGFQIIGVLDFSLIGILAKISTILADHSIGIFVVSTYNTDYILVKEENFEKAAKVLKKENYEIKSGEKFYE